MRYSPESQPHGEPHSWLDLAQYEEGFVAGMQSAATFAASDVLKKPQSQIDLFSALLQEGAYHDYVTVLLLASRELSQKEPNAQIAHASHVALDHVMSLAPPGMSPGRLEFSLYNAAVQRLQIVKAPEAASVYAEHLRLAMYYSWVVRSLKALFNGTSLHITDTVYALPRVFSRAVSLGTLPVSGGSAIVSVCPRETYSKINPPQSIGTAPTELQFNTILQVSEYTIQDATYTAWNINWTEQRQLPQFFVAKTVVGYCCIAPISPMQSRAPSLHPMSFRGQRQSPPRQRLANNILAAIG